VSGPQPGSLLSEWASRHATVAPPDADERVRHARRLRLRAAVRRLVAHLTEGGQDATIDSGRYWFLAPVIAGSSALEQALAAGSGTEIARQWSAATAARGDDHELLHGLAVLHLERALAATSAATADRAWTQATALWALLLSDPGFLAASGSRSPDRPDDFAVLAIDRILELHRSLGARHLAAGDIERARTHARCLRLCADGGTAIDAAVRSAGVSPHRGFALGPTEIGRRAEQRLRAWCTTLIHDALAAASDPDAVAESGSWLSKHYAKGITRLEAFTSIGVPVEGVLRATLDLYNQWAYDLYVAQRVDDIDALLARAHPTAEQLMPMCDEGHGEREPNQALAKYFLTRGFRAPNAAQSTAELRRALAWNPADVNARELLDQAARDERAHEVRELIEAKQWRDAEEKALSLSELGEDANAIATLRAVIRFHHALELRDERKYSRALSLAREAAQLTDWPVVGELIASLEDAARAESFRAAMEGGDLVAAERALRAAINAFTGTQTERRQLDETLSTVLMRRAVKLVNDAHKRVMSTGPADAHEARNVLRTAAGVARDLLNEALRLNSSNSDARTNLKTLQALMKALGG
jgi:hypothetical protein